MAISITTDYHVDAAIPRTDQLQRMHAAGFDWIHWCYDWNVDVVYGADGIAAIGQEVANAGLKLLDTHGVCWGAGRESAAEPDQRAAGLKLHRDRLAFTHALGGDVVVLHPPGREDMAAGVERLVSAIHELEPLARELGVAFSIENTWPTEGNRLTIPRLLDEFPPSVMGFTFDSGHANLAGDTDWLISECFPRLNCLHLHDNDGERDLHQLPFMGTVDWDKVMAAIASAGYAKPINFELAMERSGYHDEVAFLAEAFELGTKLVK